MVQTRIHSPLCDVAVEDTASCIQHPTLLTCCQLHVAYSRLLSRRIALFCAHRIVHLLASVCVRLFARVPVTLLVACIVRIIARLIACVCARRRSGP